jgi:putative transposase
MKFFNEFIEVRKTRNRLPHWQQDGATFFITWCLADSIPQELMHRFLAAKGKWLAENPQPWSAETEAEYHRIFSMEMERLMDAGHGSCVLRKPECREILHAAMAKHEAVRFQTTPSSSCRTTFISSSPSWRGSPWRR